MERPPVPEQQGQDMTEFAKKRALSYVESGDLKGAIDSMVSDLNKDQTRPDMQKQMIGMMALDLRNKPGLTEAEVVDFIKGFV